MNQSLASILTIPPKKRTHFASIQLHGSGLGFIGGICVSSVPICGVEIPGRPHSVFHFPPLQ